MATRKRKFGADLPPEGAPSMELELYDQTFKVRGQMPGLRILRIIEALEGSEEEGMDIKVLTAFISDAFLTEDRERGMAFLENEEKIVSLPMLIEVVQWLVSEYTGNPIEPQSPSDTSSDQTGPTSTENPSSPGETSAVLTDTPSGPQVQPTPVAQS